MAGKKRGRARHPWRRRAWLALGTLVLLALGLAAGAAWAWQQVTVPYRGFAGTEQRFSVEPGTSARRILDQAQAAGIIADARLARLYLRFGLDDRPLQAGEYAFRGATSLQQVLDKLARGDVEPLIVTLVEGLTLAETAQALAAAGLGPEPELARWMGDPTPIRDLDPAAPNLEGYLFPDTYRFAPGTSAREVVATLVRTFRQRFETDVRPLLAAATPSDLRPLVILASIVEKEAQADAERPLIAAVYRNRLDRGIGLYADPTIIYALKLAGRWDGNLRKPDLDLDSPYNTYRRAGLPPGPIGSPGLASLVAAARPAAVPYLYFVSRNDGTHVFARTLAEHNTNVERWQRRYWRERWAAERRAGGRR